MAAYRVVLRPPVRGEIAEAMKWYRERLPGLDQTFADTLYQALERLEVSPEMYAKVRGNVRRVVLHRFPYALFYVVEESDVVVLACIHEHRNPERWPQE